VGVGEVGGTVRVGCGWGGEVEVFRVVGVCFLLLVLTCFWLLFFDELSLRLGFAFFVALYFVFLCNEPGICVVWDFLFPVSKMFSLF